MTQDAVWKVNFKAVKGACWGSELPLTALHPPSPTCPVRLIGICAKSSVLRARASSNGSQRLPPAGRCHGGTGRENNAQPTSLRNSLFDGLWVNACLDIIRRWDPDVQLSGGTFQRERTKW